MESWRNNAGGEPLYAYCKASDGKVFHIPGFVCEHPSCPPDA